MTRRRIATALLRLAVAGLFALPLLFVLSVILGFSEELGLVHLVFRKPFFLVSSDPAAAQREGYNLALWDLLFYLSFGFVITSSVAIGGVLIVFSYLVIPAVIVALFVRGMGARLVAGWAVGFLGSALGLYASFTLDLPTGAAVVATFGVMLVAAIAVHVLARATGRELGERLEASGHR